MTVTFSLSTGPVESVPDRSVYSRCLAGVFNGTTGTVKIRRILARLPTMGFYLESSLNGQTLSYMPIGNLVVERCSAYTGGTSIAAVPHDTDEPACPVEVVKAPDTAAVGDRIRLIQDGMLPQWNTAATLPVSINAVGGGALGRKCGHPAVRLEGWPASAATPIRLQEDEGVVVRSDQRFGGSCAQWIFAVSVKVGTAAYTFDVPVVAQYPGQPWFVIMNTGATVAEILSIEQRAPVSQFVVGASNAGNMLKIGECPKPEQYAEVTPLYHDSASSPPSGLLTYKNAVVSSVVGLTPEAFEAIDQIDLSSATASVQYAFGLSGMIAARAMIPDQFNRDFGFPHVAGVELWSMEAPPIVLAPGEGLGVFGSYFALVVSLSFAMTLLSTPSALDIEIVGTYEPEEVAPGGGATDYAFFG